MNEMQEIAKVFFKLGTISFGGPAAHIAMMEKEIVQMAIHISHERAKWKGLIVARLCFILPAVVITGIFAVLSAIKWGKTQSLIGEQALLPLQALY
jgi:chromate transporter